MLIINKITTPELIYSFNSLKAKGLSLYKSSKGKYIAHETMKNKKVAKASL